MYWALVFGIPWIAAAIGSFVIKEDGPFVAAFLAMIVLAILFNRCQ